MVHCWNKCKFHDAFAEFDRAKNNEKIKLKYVLILSTKINLFP